MTLNKENGIPLSAQSKYSQLKTIFWKSQKYSAKRACELAHLPPTKANIQLAHSVRNRVKRDLTKIKADPHSDLFRALHETGVVHRVRFGFASSAPPELVRWVCDCASKGGRRVGEWYVSANRNSMLVYRDESSDFTILLHKNGGCEISVSRRFQRSLTPEKEYDLGYRVLGVFHQVQVKRFGGLMCADMNFVRQYRRWANNFGRRSQQVVYLEGTKFPPFRIDRLRAAGATFYADASRPTGLEVQESVPVVSNRKVIDLQYRILDALERLEQIDEARLRTETDRYEAVVKLNQTINELLGNTPHPSKPVDKRQFS